MQDDKQFDIKACLTDIEQAIQEINEFLPVEKNYIAFQNDLTHLAVNPNEVLAFQ